jgi:aldose 1-epimerase
MLHHKTNTHAEIFGSLPDGRIVHSYELSNQNGMQLKVINYGATITSLKIPLENGHFIDVVLGFDTLNDYIKSFELKSPPYFGATIGRFAGRIKNSTFSLNQKAIYLNTNNNNHSLHGGNKGFSIKLWDVESINYDMNSSITLTYASPDGEENYPGNLLVVVTYSLSNQNELMIEYKALATADTIVNLTHHSYFNLDGHQSNLSEQELFVNSNLLLETDSEYIPSGNYINLDNHAFDFREPKKCPSKIDNTFVLENQNILAASLFSKNNNLKMTVETNQPGVHIYVGGNCFNLLKGKGSTDYDAVSGICFETQNFPDAPNHSNFPSSILKKGECYQHKTIYKFQIL